jgi:hypothetical protein
MKVRFTPVAIVLFSLLALVGCKKDDPAPLESEVKGKLLAGEKDASKNWRLLGVTVATASNPAQALNYPACFLDNESQSVPQPILILLKRAIGPLRQMGLL